MFQRFDASSLEFIALDTSIIAAAILARIATIGFVSKANNCLLT